MSLSLFFFLNKLHHDKIFMKNKASFGPRHATLCLAICRLSPQAKFVVMFNMQPMFSLLQ